MSSKHRRPPGRPRSDQSGQPTDELILQTAARLFLSNGYQIVSIDDVAEACGVTKATVYYYFGNKAHLFTETMLAVMNKVRDRISAMMSVQKPLRARLLEVAEAHLKATFQFDIDGLMRETKSQLSDDQTALIREAEERMYGAIEKAFQHAIDDGEILDINPAFAAHAYVSLLKVGNVQLADDTSLFQSSREASENIVSLLWNGIKQ